MYFYSYPNRWKWPKKQSAYIPNLLLFQDFNHQLQGIWKFSRTFLKQNFYLVDSEKKALFWRFFFAQRVWIQTIYHWFKLVNSLSKLDIWGVSTMHQKWEKRETRNCWILFWKYFIDDFFSFQTNATVYQKVHFLEYLVALFWISKHCAGQKRWPHCLSSDTNWLTSSQWLESLWHQKLMPKTFTNLQLDNNPICLISKSCFRFNGNEW